jgi:hypothetical protein
MKPLAGYLQADPSGAEPRGSFGHLTAGLDRLREGAMVCGKSTMAGAKALEFYWQFLA